MEGTCAVDVRWASARSRKGTWKARTKKYGKRLEKFGQMGNMVSKPCEEQNTFRILPARCIYVIYLILCRSRDSSVGIVTGYMAGVRIAAGPRPILGPTQPPIRWVPGALSTEAKRPESKTNHWPPSSAEVKIGGGIPPLPISLQGVVLN
jgi:hypothetical protein